MRYTLIVLALLSIPMLSGAGELPASRCGHSLLHDRNHRRRRGQNTELSRPLDPRWPGTIWSERLIPEGIRAEVEHNEHNEMQAPHEHFNYQTAANGWSITPMAH